MSNQGKIEDLLLKILQQESLSRNEICCKLRELITLSGGTVTTDVVPGSILLTSGGTASFTIDGARSVNLSVISLSTGTVTVTTDIGTTNISYPGVSLGWGIDKLSDAGLTEIIINVTGDAIVLVTYTTV